MSLPAPPLGLEVGVLEGVMAADTEGCLGELRAGNLVPHLYKYLASAKVSRKQEGLEKHYER